jgi:mannosylglycerate hydrolase MGH1-like protein
LREFLKKPAAADWGSALGALEQLWPDAAFTKQITKKVAVAADWLIAERDREESGLFDIARDDRSLDARTTGTGAGRIKGIENSVYAYRLFRWLEHCATRTGGDSSNWKTHADRTRDAIHEKMWSPSTAMFGDVDAKTFAHTGVKHARCFLPYGTDIADASHIAGLEKHLLNAAEFFTAFPVPSISVDDPRFSAEGEWKSRRAGEPWNGRVYPEVNAEVVDAFAHAARVHAPKLRGHAAALLRRFIRMMFHNGELREVNSYEHYNPLTGHASVFRGADDVQHAWVNDLIIRHVIGIDVSDAGITVDPLPFELEFAEICGLKIRGKSIDVHIEGTAVAVTIDGEMTLGTLGIAMVFATPSTG